MTHYHAYAYTGAQYPDTHVRSGRAPKQYLPIEIKDTAGPNTRLNTLDDALTWIEKELTTHEPDTTSPAPLAARLTYARTTLQQTAPGYLVYGYWTRTQQYAARRILRCIHCPD